MTTVAVPCPAAECDVEVPVEVLYIASKYDWRRGWKPARLIARVPENCPRGDALDGHARERLEREAIAARECGYCFDLITSAQQSFSVKYGCVHESCRSEYSAMMVEQECDDEPRAVAHVAEFPVGAYKPWIK